MQTKRQELEQLIEESKKEIQQFSSENLFAEAFSEVDREATLEAFRGIPLIDILPTQKQEEIVKIIFESAFNFLMENFRKELAGFFDYWKNMLPSEENLTKMTDAEIDEQIMAPFEESLQKVFESSMEKTYAIMLGETE